MWVFLSYLTGLVAAGLGWALYNGAGGCLTDLGDRANQMMLLHWFCLGGTWGGVFAGLVALLVALRVRRRRLTAGSSSECESEESAKSERAAESERARASGICGYVLAGIAVSLAVVVAWTAYYQSPRRRAARVMAPFIEANAELLDAYISTGDDFVTKESRQILAAYTYVRHAGIVAAAAEIGGDRRSLASLMRYVGLCHKYVPPASRAAQEEILQRLLTRNSSEEARKLAEGIRGMRVHRHQIHSILKLHRRAYQLAGGDPRDIRDGRGCLLQAKPFKRKKLIMAELKLHGQIIGMDNLRVGGMIRKGWYRLTQERWDENRKTLDKYLSEGVKERLENAEARFGLQERFVQVQKMPSKQASHRAERKGYRAVPLPPGW